MTSDKMGEKYEIFNVGTGSPVSVLELLTRFEAVNNLKLPYKIVGRRPGDVPAVWADTAVANEVLGWKAERELDDTLRSAWAWEKHIRNINDTERNKKFEIRRYYPCDYRQCQRRICHTVGTRCRNSSYKRS